MMATPGMVEPDGVEKLSSNVMNYLVWRYLQESGFGKTAKQLQYQWMGREQSPESLPFAPKIKKSCLVHMAQDGLLLDHLQAEVKKVDNLHNCARKGTRNSHNAPDQSPICLRRRPREEILNTGRRTARKEVAHTVHIASAEHH